MSTKVSKLWLLGPPFAILVTGLAYYAKFEGARTWVDARFPWVAENIGQRLPPLVITEQAATTDETAPPPSAIGVPPADAPPPAPPKPGFVAADGTIRLDLLAANKAAWPKGIHLRRPTEFPAVISGKAVGKVMAPAGSETRLVAIQGDKLGLEFRGGGAFVDPAATDLAEQLRSGNR